MTPITALVAAAYLAFAPPPTQTVSAWADGHRILSAEGSAEPGRWRTDRVPIARPIMDAMTDPAVHTLVLECASQLCKSEVLLNALGRLIDIDPGPILLVQPTLEDARKFSRQRITPMLRDTPTLRGKVRTGRVKDASSSTLLKAIALDTPIPTPSGWTTMGALKVGDLVFDEQGRPRVVRGVSEIFTQGECHRVTFSDGVAIIADAGHGWVVESVCHGIIGREVLTTTEIAERLWVERSGRRYARYAVRSTQPLRLPEREVSVDPYVLGAWLGNGDAHRAALTEGDLDFEEMADHIRACGVEVTIRRPPTRAVQLFLDADVAAALRRLGLIRPKRERESRKAIPKPYLRASDRQRLALLQGLMDTDGQTTNRDGVCVFTTTSTAIAEGFAELLATLGIKYGRRETQPYYTKPPSRTKITGKPASVFSFRADPQMPVFRLKRKLAILAKAKPATRRTTTRRIVAIDRVATVPTRCITVEGPSHLYLAGDRMIPTHNTFPGGHLTLAGANSPSGLASMPIRVLLADELDRWPTTAGDEGDPWAIASKRTTTFWNRLRVAVSSPTIDGASKIHALFLEGDQRRFFVPCPHCDARFVIVWHRAIRGVLCGFVRWPAGEPARAYVECPSCTRAIEHSAKPWMLARAEDRPTRPDQDGPPAPGVRSFHVPGMYSPWKSWGEMAVDFLAAKRGGPETLKVFINTDLAETWTVPTEQVEPSTLVARREKYEPEVPAGACCLTMGVDVQDDRLEYRVDAWGPGEEAWLAVDVGRIPGDPSRKEPWTELDQVLARTYEHACGARLPILATCIDTAGHRTDYAYEFVKRHLHQRVYATIGRAHVPLLISTPSPKRSGDQPRAVDLYTIGVDHCKSLLASRLKETERGPGFLHLSLLADEEFCAQLVSERLVTTFERGLAVQTWIKTRPRNEQLDLWSLSLAALRLLRPRFDDMAAVLAAYTPEVQPAAPAAAAPAPHRWTTRSRYLGGP